MKLKISRSELLTGFQRVQGVVEKRNTMPILSNMLFEAKGDRVILFATDLEIGIRGTYKAEVSQPGGVTVSARKLYEIIRELPDGMVTISSKEDHAVQIEAGKSEFKVLGLPPQEFPAMPTVESEPLMAVDRKTLSDLIRKTVFTASDNNARYILNGLLVTLYAKDKKPFLRFVGTDGHRLAVIERPLDGGTVRGLPQELTAVIPKKAATEIKKLLEENEEGPELGVSKNQMIFKRGGLLLLARLMEGSYPNYQQVIPTENEKRAAVKRTELEGALRRVSILSREKTSAIKLALEPGTLTLSSSNPDMGEAKETIGAKFNQEGVTTGFNARYLLDALSAIDAEEAVLEFKDALSPCIIRQADDPDYLCVVMPMRV
ncbi:MAG TPA: DNA polymerase III subunit beta [Nitrospiria bacterium]|nr:DNA polymerase III subunit beta [Nitrospiria bacterium]